MNENVDIIVNDKIDPSISKKLNNIQKGSANAHRGIERLNDALRRVDTSAISRLENILSRYSGISTRAASANERLAKAQAQTTTAQQQAAAASTRATTAITQQQAATARLATAISNQQSAASRAVTAQNNATASTLRLQRAQQQLAQQANKTNYSFGRLLATVAAFAGIGLSAGAIVQAADAYTVLQNKLQVVAKSQEQVNALTKEMFELAKRSRSDVNSSTQAFTRFDLALVQLGKSQKDSIRLTETVNKMLVLSGAESSEASSALLQLSQAFNKGKLDGDEFRSVMELMPLAADAIAKQLGVTRGELLKLAPQGKITADVMQKAFAAVADEVDKKFSKTVPTLSQAFTQFRNSATQAFGELDKAAGITAKLSKFIIALANNMDVLAVAVTAVGSAMVVAFGGRLIRLLAAARAAMISFTVAMMANPIGLIAVAISTAAMAIYQFGDAIEIVSGTGISLLDGLKAAFSYVTDAAKIAFEFLTDGFNTVLNWAEKVIPGITDVFFKVFNFIIGYNKKMINGMIGLFVFAANVIPLSWKTVGKAFYNIFATIYNYGAEAVENLVNVWANGASKIVDLGASFAPETVKSINDALSKMKLELPRMDLAEGVSSFGSELKTLFEESFSVDYLGNLADDFIKRAQQISDARRKAEEAVLRESSSVAPTGGDGKKGKDKAADILAKFNRELEQEYKLLQMITPVRQTEQRIMELSNQLLDAKSKLEKKDEEAIRRKLNTLQQMEGINRNLNDIYSQTAGQVMELSYQYDALNLALQSGMINMDDYSLRLNKIYYQLEALKLQMQEGSIVDAFKVGLWSLVADYEGVLVGLSKNFGDFFKSLSQGFADSIGQAIVMGDDLKTSLINVARQGVAALISGLIQLGIQYLINAALSDAIQKKQLVSQTGQSIAAGKAVAAAWAPAAAAVSLASFGANAEPAILGMAAANIFSASMATIGGLTGFKSGGYTGNVPTGAVAGVVHGQEYVMNASTVKRVGVGNLEAMNRGGSPMGTRSEPPQINIVNMPGVETEVTSVDDGRIELIARRVVRREAGAVVARELGDQNSAVRKSLNKNTNTSARKNGNA